MKIINAIFLLLFCSVARAQQPSNLDLGGLMDFVSETAKSARGGSAITINEKVSGILYVPLRVLTSSDKSINYAHFGFGANAYQDGHAVKGQPLLVLAGNTPALAHKLTSGWGWYQSHVTETKLPDIYFGPFIKAPMPGIAWTWKNSLGGIVSIGFGNAAKN